MLNKTKKNMNKILKNVKNIFTKIKYYDILIKVLKVHIQFSGDDDIEEIPVPIPNTEVKLYCADDICGLPC